ncbi:MAG: NAD-dependent epimerase/dehydratase family protein [Sandaracinaceae bacterium]|nr:NAD-dependent epimerase/dehydratase family protein [Sandaracinaceae bacterium]
MTGACSFLGRNLVGVLEEREDVERIVVLDIASPPTAGRKSRAYRVDLTQPAVSARLTEILRAEKVTELAHLAFLASPTTAEPWAHELESVGTMHVLHACRESPVERVVVSSQTMLYGPHPANPNFLLEGAELRGLRGGGSSPFGRSFGRAECSFLADKIDAEREVERFVQARPDTSVAVLRFAPMLGPTVRTWVTRWLSRRIVPTLLGFDPLVQLLHEMDAVSALVLALDPSRWEHGRGRGAFNVVSQGVLPISTVIKLAGRAALPVPGPLLTRSTELLWMAGLNEVPSPFVAFLRHLCVADGSRARRELGFVPQFTTKEAVLDFGGALRLREAHLLSPSA